MAELIIVIPCRNASKWIKACVESVFAQLGGVKARVVVFDDCSTDASLEVLEQLGADYDFDILKSTAASPKGPFWIFNRVVEKYKADFYQTLDADDMLLEGASRHLMDYAATGGFGVVNGQGEFFYDIPENPAPERWYPTQANKFLQIIRRNSVMLNSGKVLTRAAVEKLGPMCEDFICAMDVEYFFRADSLGIGLSNSPQKTVKVRLHSSGGSLTSSNRTDHRSDYRQQAHDMIFEKYPPRCNFAPEFEEFFKKELSLHGPNPSLYSQYTHYLEQYCQMLLYTSAKTETKLERIIRRPASRMLIQLVLSRWENILLSGTKRVYLFGAGKHTNWLCGLVQDKTGPQIAGIIDDDKQKHGQLLCGFEVCCFEQAKKDKDAFVVISSDTFVAKMKTRLEEAGVNSQRIVDLYHDIPQGPYLGLNTFWMWL